MHRMGRRLWMVALACAGLVASTVPQAGAHATTGLAWQPCETEGPAECAEFEVPLDYAHPSGRTLTLGVSRLPATEPSRRIGVLVTHFGGPGVAGADGLLDPRAPQVFDGVNRRFDLIAFDQRGVRGTAAVDCRYNPSALGLPSLPALLNGPVDHGLLLRGTQAYIDRCLAVNDRAVLPYLTTGNTSRDIDLLRASLGEQRINYLGFSYGTLLGATYESMFPTRVRASVLDGGLDSSFLRRPARWARGQSQGFEIALGRFLQTCATHQDVCRFGGDDPWAAYDALVEELNRRPLPGPSANPAPVTGQDVLDATAWVLYAKQDWGRLGVALAEAAHGDGARMRFLSDLQSGRAPDGTYDPAGDRFFAYTATEGRLDQSLDTYLEMADEDADLFPHFGGAGSGAAARKLWPIEPRGAFYGPFSAGGGLPTLVVGITYDPATPFKQSVRLTRELGNARLLTLRGDGHNAYSLGGSPCIDGAVEAYLEDGVVPAIGTTCSQALPFEIPPDDPDAGTGGVGIRYR